MEKNINMEYTELEINAFEEMLKDNENLTFESLKRAYIKNSFL